MIATLSGNIQEIIDDTLVLNVRGVGYGLTMPYSKMDRLTVGEEVMLYIYEHIKEDAHTLYGFKDLSDKKLFEQLLSVKNIGPKAAIAVLDIGPGESVRVTIASGDVKMLQTAKGVGKRAAEQIVVELRDKVGLPSTQEAEGLVGRGGLSMQDEATQALIALGFSETDASLALQGVDINLPTEDRIKLALRGRI
ncbi:MAG: Holliday junction branch migration protein RuvA [Patescibacteria group bacterium]|jgi:Holliday junction DNA helicase RuvA|nr:Holliday junction branch migration protein RuvA [Patescibacteria group bacterium]